MNHGTFLIATVRPGQIHGNLSWLIWGDPPLRPADPLDFAASPELDAVYELYKVAYQALDDDLNVRMPKGMLEYDRWVLISEEPGKVSGFACFKTTQCGLKLGLLASDGTPAAKDAVKTLLRLCFNVEGVYGEVSGRTEAAIHGYATEVPPSAVEGILGKPIEPDEDGRHYFREISRVGRKRKLMVGRPFID